MQNDEWLATTYREGRSGGFALFCGARSSIGLIPDGMESATYTLVGDFDVIKQQGRLAQ
jgi:hypothetical protein